MFSRSLFYSVVSAASLFMAVPATASTVDLTFDGFDLGGSQAVSLRIPNRSRSLNVLAGGFSMSNGANSFVAWCIDLYDTIGQRGATTEYTEIAEDDILSTVRPGQRVNSATEVSLLNSLFTGFGSIAQLDTIHSAAFQVAIWEIVEDGNLNLSQGGFRAYGNSAVTSLAQSWLDNLDQFGDDYNLTFFLDQTGPSYRQDVVTGTLAPVPLPAGALLLLTGLGGLAVARRRNRAA